MFEDLRPQKSIDLRGTSYEILFKAAHMDPSKVEIKHLISVSQEIADSLPVLESIEHMKLCLDLAKKALNG